MAKYVCPQCLKAFIYCKGCALTPDIYKEKGFCSKACYNASKTEIPKKVEEDPIEIEALTVAVEPIIESIVIEDKITEDEATFITEIEVELFESEIDGIRE